MRRSGVLMHLSSLSSPYGVGTMGKEAFEFVDFLHESKQSCWQILPICPTSYGDSPYQSYSTFAGNPYFIDLDKLKEMGLLEAEDYEKIDWGSTTDHVDYGILYSKKYPILRKAAERFLEEPTEAYFEFCAEQEDWLSDFSIFMALKEVHSGNPWYEWEEEYRRHEDAALEKASEEYRKEMDIWKVYQFFFFQQWEELKAYAKEKEIEIIGDLPIYVSLDSVDVWAHPELFQLDENRVPKEVAGCPPDGFSEDGQLWGNPLYDWEYMEETGYQWWIERIRYICNVYDIVRIDHFRGFDSYYAIPYGEKTAKRGSWKQGPGMKLFRKAEEVIGRQRIIAEDLGYLTESVRELLKESGFPGMKVMEFAFDNVNAGDNEYLLHNFVRNCVAYAGTHDNLTIQGWFEEAPAEVTEYAKKYLRMGEGEVHWEMLAALWSSVADLVIAQAQDLLGLGKEARMNEPSTLGKNWSWRAEPGVFTHALAYQLRNLTKLYGR